MPPPPPIDTSAWPTGRPHISYEEFDAQELADMAELRERALDYVMSFRSAVSIAELKLYCVLAEDWAANVWDGNDLSECYPIPVARTREHARMLMDRVEFIRKGFIPTA
ncbi:MAG TPA: hypothetical protein VIR81_06925 [Myxococcales bacterium]